MGYPLIPSPGGSFGGGEQIMAEDKPIQQSKLDMQTPQETKVVVQVQPWYQSRTVIVNGILFLAASFVQIVDLLTGANLLEKLVSTFTSDPEKVSNTITVITQVYTVVSLWLRSKTQSPITFASSKKD